MELFNGCDKNYLQDLIKFVNDNFGGDNVKEYNKILKVVEKEVIEKLISSILKEDLLEIIEINNKPFTRKVDIQISFNFKQNFDNLIKFKKEDKFLILIINFKSINKLNRISLNGYPLKQSKKRTIDGNPILKEVHDPFKILDIIMKYGNFQNQFIESYKFELLNSIANLTLSYLLTNKNIGKIKNEAIENGCGDILEYVDYKLKKDLNFNVTIFYEQVLVSGHSYYPFSKTKIGFSPEQIFKYCSEFSNSFKMKFIAIHNSICKTSKLNLNEEFYKIFSFINLKENVLKHLNYMCLNIDDYQISIAHPYQIEQIVPSMYIDEINSKKIIIFPFKDKELPEFGAGISTRTVFPINGNKECSLMIPCIKSSLSVIITSFRRNIQLPYTLSCAKKSETLNIIHKKEKYYLKDSIFLYELYSVGVSNEENNILKSKSLNTIFRVNPNSLLIEDHHIIPSCSLFEKSPITNHSKTICWDIIKKYEKFINDNNDAPSIAPIKWLKNYVYIVTRPVLRLFLTYGILLEAHLQNTMWLINSKSGGICKAVFRDWDGITINQDRIKRHEAELGFINEDHFEKSVSFEECRIKFYHRFVINNLGELVLNISTDFNIDENILWLEIKTIMGDLFDEIKNDEPNLQYKQEIQNDKDFILNSKLISGPAFHKSKFSVHTDMFQTPSFYHFNNPLFFGI